MSAATMATTTSKTTDPSTLVASVDPAADGPGVSNCKRLSADVMVQSSMPSSMSKSTTLPFSTTTAKRLKQVQMPKPMSSARPRFLTKSPSPKKGLDNYQFGYR
jgi:hypothetical protein